ncbi:MAG: hypothetical protein ACFFCP_08205 [Promethearchaeota archaeon]
MTGEEGLELVFLGTGAAITLPAFFCTCATCEEAKKNPECIITHVSYHGWENDKLEAGMTAEEREDYVSRYPVLRIAYDGMRVSL